jgi:FKBP-type peptidyl-prolyl cis-trans isomerase
MSKYGTPFLLFVVLSFLGCGSSDDDSMQEIQDFILRQPLEFTRSTTGLYYSIERSTGSDRARFSDFVQFDFRQFDINRFEIANSLNMGTPAAIEVDLLLDGLAEAMLFLGPGDRGTFIVPPSLSSEEITEGALIYEIDMLGVFEDVVEYNDQLFLDYFEENGIPVPQRMDNGLYIEIDEPGNEIRPNETSAITIAYEGFLVDGTVFDSTIERGAAERFRLNQVIEGWRIALQSFGVGGTGTIYIPSYLGFGPAGSTGVPPNAPLIFDIELINVN